MSLFKRNDTWKAEVWMNNKRISSQAGFASKTDAKAWHDQQLNEHAKNPGQQNKSEDILFEEVLEQFQKVHLPTISESTGMRYRLDIEARIRPYFRFRPIKRINAALVETFRSEVMETLSAKSVNNCMSVLQTIFKKAIEWDLIEKNPIKVARLKIPEVKYTWWDKKEHITEFLKEAEKTRYYAAFRLSLECGLRLGEIVGLSKQDVDLERCQIHVHRQWLDKLYCYGPTKGRRERFISFDPSSSLKTALKEAIKKSPDKEIIFVTQSGKRVLGRKLGGELFYRLIERAKVPRIRFHDLRHTFASWYMIEVDDIWSLKGILGHADVQTTQQYAHLSQKHQRIPTLNFTSPKGAGVGRS